MHRGFKKLLSKVGNKTSLSTKANKPRNSSQSKLRQPRKIKLHNDCGCE